MVLRVLVINKRNRGPVMVCGGNSACTWLTLCLWHMEGGDFTARNWKGMWQVNHTCNDSNLPVSTPLNYTNSRVCTSFNLRTLWTLKWQNNTQIINSPQQVTQGPVFTGIRRYSTNYRDPTSYILYLGGGTHTIRLKRNKRITNSDECNDNYEQDDMIGNYWGGRGRLL